MAYPRQKLTSEQITELAHGWKAARGSQNQAAPARWPQGEHLQARRNNDAKLTMIAMFIRTVTHVASRLPFLIKGANFRAPGIGEERIKSLRKTRR